MLMTVLNLGKFLAMTRSRSDTYLKGDLIKTKLIHSKMNKGMDVHQL